jgi:N-acyl-D-amino-acid deacylase
MLVAPIRSTTSIVIPSTGSSSSKLSILDDLFEMFMQEHKIPGASVAVSKDSHVIYARGFGYADLDDKQLVQPDSLLRIASLSKPITATAILQLVDRGKIQLDEPMLNYLSRDLSAPNSPDQNLSKVTIRQLLQHQGGFDRDKSFDPMFRLVEIATDPNSLPKVLKDEIISFMLEQPLDFVPGSKHVYSNFGYCVLGKIIEIVSKEPYENFVRGNVLGPAGATSARLGRTLLQDRADCEVRYYDISLPPEVAIFGPGIGEMVDTPYGAWCLEIMDSHGGWIASATDLVRFASAFDKPDACKILSPQGIKQMFGRSELEKGAPYYAGCGWYVREFGRNLRNAWHAGALAGTSTMLVRRHDGINWAVLFNARAAESGEYFSTLIDPLMQNALNRTSLSC